VIRINPPLNAELVQVMHEYAAEEHPPELEPDAPDEHCPWRPSMNGSELIHMGQRTENDAAWVDYLDELFISPYRRKLTLEEDTTHQENHAGQQP
jgi:hypothetical protein